MLNSAWRSLFLINFARSLMVVFTTDSCSDAENRRWWYGTAVGRTVVASRVKLKRD